MEKRRGRNKKEICGFGIFCVFGWSIFKNLIYFRVCKKIFIFKV